MTGLRILCPVTGKQVYGTVARADHFRVEVEVETGVPYRIYRCEHCGWLHLTSQPSRRRGRPRPEAAA